MLRNFIVSSLCLEFGVALRTGHDLRKSVKGPARKDRSLLARRTTLFEIDRSNDLFSDRDAKLSGLMSLTRTVFGCAVPCLRSVRWRYQREVWVKSVAC